MTRWRTAEIHREAPRRSAPGSNGGRSAIELAILQGIEHVEAGHPAEDRESQHQRCRRDISPNRDPGAQRRPRQCQAEQQMGEGCESLAVGVAEDDRQGQMD